ncbi:MotA/TolQ/ExbB proton channel family protein [Photobacterium sp. WH77]|uniref:MotA/TolQ/ExbB proton channel family protein n=1 Tax=Photobacterium arenosum TaxID=2774143 RepID=A0ABR9BFF3_9GAMM|nr:MULTISPECIES: MotA/TolQ/ExbB proton channel family protein [Photobacterium]MBD8511292.1 MotA/TolQ/ExbB proton channel family protein [Photobacterium arenosum]MCG2838413.1 MotA/TolQ/ExbB proton channel family protein [Photobacterium sp. WH77]MCG2846030.1 MotA/TolQ/ExbB proton channel family protein [Photobacterium sp. WH80]MDO6582085.1 MotA/TolQ/ExbB proton channel family protein [Photobacterium sp. 2_MG-2023]
MKLKTLALALTLFSVSTSVLAVDGLVEKTRQEQKSEQAHNQTREAGFKQTEAEIRAQKDALLATRESLNTEIDNLSSTFSTNEKSLAQLEEELRLESGSLGELFGVVRQTAKDLQAELETSVTSADRHQYTAVVNDIVDAKALPSLKQLNGLWQGMNEQILASSEMRKVSVSYINGEGYQSTVDAYRLGSIGLIGEQGYLAWNGIRQVATPYLKQPENGPVASQIASLQQAGLQMAVVDPSRGKMLEQLAHAPSLTERLSQGGVVGKIILGLLAIGIIIALYRGCKLIWIRQQINAQLKKPENPGNNPLGRVLSVYDTDQKRSVEALELRLLETIVDEQQGLERGLSMLKLLAALAPMLGLLGTVTGMIETFQVITQFGNGDPKVMAGGISMALVTTVLGLVSAMPLLLAHNLLSAQADAIRSILEKQGISLVAAEAEKTGSTA